MNREDYCKLKLEDLNITEWFGKKGVWLCKNKFGIPYFCELSNINEKMLKLIEIGYFNQVSIPNNYKKIKEYVRS